MRGRWGGRVLREESQGMGPEKKMRDQELGGVGLVGELGLVVKMGYKTGVWGKIKVEKGGVKGKRAAGRQKGGAEGTQLRLT